MEKITSWTKAQAVNRWRSRTDCKFSRKNIIRFDEKEAKAIGKMSREN